MTVKFVLREDKTDQNELVLVFIDVNFEGLWLRCFTREKCLLKEWNPDKQRFRKGKTGAKEANNVLEAIAERVQKRYRDLRTAGIPPTLALLRDVINPVATKPEQGMAEAMTSFIGVLCGRGYAFNTLRHYGTVRNHLATFLASGRRKKISVADYGLTRRFCEVSAHDIRIGRQRHLYGAEGRKTLSAVRPGRAETKARVEARYADQAKTYLTGSDLAALAVVKLPKTLEPTRDVFLFCCYTGLRYSNVAALHRGNLHALRANGDGDQVLRLVQTKTRATVSVYLSRLAAEILDRYAAAERLGEDAKLLPLLANQPMNRYLKKITQLAGLTRLVEVVSTAGGWVVKEAVPLHGLVTMHTARNTFAVQSLLRGMPVAVLQRVMGHAKIQNTMKSEVCSGGRGVAAPGYAGGLGRAGHSKQPSRARGYRLLGADSGVIQQQHTRKGPAVDYHTPGFCWVFTWVGGAFVLAGSWRMDRYYAGRCLLAYHLFRAALTSVASRPV